jgi:hypothetical protein
MFQPSAAFDDSCSTSRGEFTGFEPWYCDDAGDLCSQVVTPEVRLLDRQAFVDLESDVPY